MKLIRCKKCKQMYEVISINQKFCPACTKKEYDRYLFVRSYVKEHPGITVRQVAEDLGLDTSIIVRYLKEEKLEISGSTSSAAFLSCESCGVEIKTGTHCPNCKRNLSIGESSSVNPFSSRETSENYGMMFTAKSKR